VHVEVLSHQRRWINYNIRDVLRVGQGFIQADFVSLYNSMGRKIHNLILVIHYVRHRGTIIERTYVDNFFKGKHTYVTTISILDYLFKSTRIFDKFDELIFSGDTGSGFRQSETIYYYSTLFFKYGKNIRVHFLAPRHAFNMCDAHGGQLSRIFSAEKCSSQALITPADCAAAVKRSKLANTFSFYHENTENVDKSILDPSKCRKVPGIMKLHAFEFVYKNERGIHTRTEGVAIASRLSGAESKTVLFDTRTRKKGSRCTDCEKNFKRPTLKHDTKTCPVKNRSAFIDASVLPGHTAGAC
jgi:hypothetical protein